jgi:ribosomal protein S18 acetylase RimI-like enzyme
MTIRPVTADDTIPLAAFWRLVFPEYEDPKRPHRDAVANVQRKLAFGDGLFWLVESEGGIIASVMAEYDGHRGWIYSLGVHPDARRSDVARTLVAHAEQALAALVCPKVNVQVLLGNDGAQSFWRSVGYAQDDVVSFGKRLR